MSSQTNLPGIVYYILLYGYQILVSNGDFPWLNTADGFLLTVPIALMTALFFQWAMIPFHLYSVRNDFDSAVFLFVNITSFSSISPAASMNSCISIPSLMPYDPNKNSLAAPNHLSLRAFTPCLDDPSTYH